MKKINISGNEEASLDFIDKLQNHPLLADYVIDIYNANEFSIYLEETLHCNSCKGLENCRNFNSGYRTKIVSDSFVLVPCKYKKENILKAKEKSHIKTLFVSKSILNANLENMDVSTENRKKVYDFIVKFIQNMRQDIFTKGLYIYGGFSIGKTYILGCIANELAKYNIESLIIYFPDLVVELKNSIGSSRLEELINYLKSVDVLLLDDLGSENMTPWLRDEILGSVLNFRLMEEKPIFITSNIDPTTDDLLNHLSITRVPSETLKAMRIKSRLEGLVVPIELDNKSYKR